MLCPKVVRFMVLIKTVGSYLFPKYEHFKVLNKTLLSFVAGAHEAPPDRRPVPFAKYETSKQDRMERES